MSTPDSSLTPASTPTGTPPATTPTGTAATGAPAANSPAAAAAPKTKTADETDARHWRRLVGFIKKADAAKQLIGALTPIVSLDPKAKNGKATLQISDVRARTPGLVNLATDEEFLFPDDKGTPTP